MIDKNEVEKIIREILLDSPIFLVDLKISSGGKITVILDGDNGVTIKDCAEVSRTIESKLDRDKEDFELEVSSAGLDKPLRLKRQFKKCKGRRISLLTKDGLKVSGKVVSVDEKSFKVERDLPRKRKKDAMPENPFLQIETDQVQEIKVLVSFK